MIKRKELKDRFLAKIGKFTKHAQVNYPDENLTKALAFTKDLQDERKEEQDTLDQRWRDCFVEDESQTKIPSKPGNEDLDQVGRRVMQAWRKFYKSLPKEQSADLRDKPPDFRFLQNAINAANADLAKKREGSSIKRGFNNICKAFDDYKNLAEVIPSGDKYICLITGSLGALAKATVNHTDVGEGISKALEEISEDISYWGRLIIEHPINEKMQSYIRELYALLFECFADIFTEWQCSNWTRIKGSFNRNTLNNIVTSHRSKMERYTGWLRREAELESKRTISDMSQATAGLRDEFAKLSSRGISLTEGFQLFLISSIAPQQQKLFLTGNHMQQTLEENLTQRAAQYIPIISEAKSEPAGMLETEEIEDGSTSSSQSVKHIYIKQHLQQVMRNLGLSLSRTDPTMPLISMADLSIGPDVFDALQKWTTSTTSSYLWIEGPADVETPSQNTMTSVSLVGVAQRSSASYLAYFGESPKARNAIDRAKRCSEGLALMIYTLISQLVNQFPEEFESNADLSEARFLCLDGTEDSITSAALVLQDLLNAFTGPLLCIIDGLQYLTYGKKDTLASIRNLVEILCTGSHSQGSARKVCFTTDGYLEVLGNITKTVKLSRVAYKNESID